MIPSSLFFLFFNTRQLWEEQELPRHEYIHLILLEHLEYIFSSSPNESKGKEMQNTLSAKRAAQEPHASLLENVERETVKMTISPDHSLSDDPQDKIRGASSQRHPQSTESSSVSHLTANERLALPGPKHRHLESLVGVWNVQLTLRPAAEAPPIISTDLICHMQWIIDGRYLEEKTEGTLGGKPYVRQGYLTYHTLLQQYEYMTMDNLDTGFMTSYSIRDDYSHISTYGSFVQAGDGQEIVGRVIKLRYVWFLEDAKNLTMHMYVTPPANQEFLLAEFIYTPQF